LLNQLFTGILAELKTARHFTKLQGIAVDLTTSLRGFSPASRLMFWTVTALCIGFVVGLGAAQVAGARAHPQCVSNGVTPTVESSPSQ
jgi:hypothetical protein